MKTTTTRAVRIGRKKSRSANAYRAAVLRNGMGTVLAAVAVRCPQFNFAGRVLFPLPIPPGDPYIFRSAGRAEAAIARTERLTRKISGSIHRDYIIEHYPALKPFASTATYEVERRTR
jgi:hypothetical protein